MMANLQNILARIAVAAHKANRAPEQVKLVAVSKGQSAESLRQLAECGQLIFGESYMQEAETKIALLADIPCLNWHFIGPLQSNKTIKAATLFSTVQSVHKIQIADRLQKHAQELDKTLDVLIQVNLANESGKSGAEANATLALARHITSLANLKLKGLMLLPPFDDNPEKTRPYFTGLRELSHRLQADLPPGSMDELSMGMSNDFEVAIEEGATMVRVGTSLFGPRAGR